MLAVETPIGFLTLQCEGEQITALRFGRVENAPEQCENKLLLTAKRQLEEYFRGERISFDLPLSPKGTPFQKDVWNALLTIPYGKTASYSDIAMQIGRPKACRAVGMANHVNPLPIFIPCHRVVGKNNSLTGYAGGLDMKTFLLALEEAHIHGKI